MIIGQRSLSSRHFLCAGPPSTTNTDSALHLYIASPSSFCVPVFSLFFQRVKFGREFDYRVLLGVVLCVMGAIKRSKTLTQPKLKIMEQLEGDGKVINGEYIKKTVFNPQSKSHNFCL